MNLTLAITDRIKQEPTPWTGPLTLLFAHTGFCIFAQAMVTLIFAGMHNLDPVKFSTA
jgi:hypothetical protein